MVILMKRIGILTFHFADNYGALLQAYALKQYLENNNNSVCFIDYVPDKEKRFYSINPFSSNYAKDCLKKIVQFPQRIFSYRKFNIFREEYLDLENRVSFDASLLEKELDCIIVGSDQVWNPAIVGDLRPYLLADIRKRCCKISYAASAGKPQFSSDEEKIFSGLLPLFKAVTVREKSTREKLSELGINCSVVIDPVYLLSANDWNLVSCPPAKFQPDQQYILIYSLRYDAQMIKAAEEYADRLGLPLYYMHPMNQKIKSSTAHIINNVGPLEFIWLIAHSKCLYTNSYHAVAFSSIFSKKFRYFHQASLGDRVNDLLQLLDVKRENDGVLSVSIDTPQFKQRKTDSEEILRHI